LQPAGFAGDNEFMRNLDEEDEYAPTLTPLIDIVFLLIIFFLVAATFVQDERDLEVDLPRTSTGEARQAMARPVVINVRDDGQIIWGGEALDVEALQGRLAAWIQQDPKHARIPVVIRSDLDSRFGIFYQIAAAAREAGVRKIQMAGAAQE
jgi:biopolymer transport protein ExbD